MAVVCFSSRSVSGWDAFLVNYWLLVGTTFAHTTTKDEVKLSKIGEIYTCSLHSEFAAICYRMLAVDLKVFFFFLSSHLILKR